MERKGNQEACILYLSGLKRRHLNVDIRHRRPLVCCHTIAGHLVQVDAIIHETEFQAAHRSLGLGIPSVFRLHIL